jgi:hypothetical protein
VQQMLEITFRAFGDNFDTTIAEIFGVTAQTHYFSLSLRESSVPNALHFAFDERRQAHLFLEYIHDSSLQGQAEFQRACRSSATTGSKPTLRANLMLASFSGCVLIRLERAPRALASCSPASKSWVATP